MARPSGRKVETEGWGARLLALPGRGRAVGGRRVRSRAASTGARVGGGGPAVDGHAATRSTQLREFGLDPRSDRARRTVALVGANSRWDAGRPAVLGGRGRGVHQRPHGRRRRLLRASTSSPIVERLLGERLDDGGWNCERANGSRPLVVRHHDQRARRAPRVRARHRRDARVDRGAPRGRGVPARASPLPPPHHGRAGRRRRSSPSCIRIAGTTTCCGRSTTSARTGAPPDPRVDDRRSGRRPRPAPRRRHVAAGPDRSPAGAWFRRARRRAGRSRRAGITLRALRVLRWGWRLKPTRRAVTK